MLLGIPRSARCVQRFDDSLNSAIHITYRISLRSSSMREPRDPLLKVVYFLYQQLHSKHIREVCEKWHRPPDARKSRPLKEKQQQSRLEREFITGGDLQNVHSWRNNKDETSVHAPESQQQPVSSLYDNDPSAGSPTETLLRLLLPLNDQVWSASQQQGSVAGSPKPIRRPH